MQVGKVLLHVLLIFFYFLSVHGPNEPKLILKDININLSHIHNKLFDHHVQDAFLQFLDILK